VSVLFNTCEVKIEEGKQHFAPLGMKSKRYEKRKANNLQERKYHQEKPDINS